MHIFCLLSASASGRTNRSHLCTTVILYDSIDLLFRNRQILTSYRIITLTNIAPDIRLLVVFDAVFQSRSVSHAAKSLGLSQPAVSTALNRLRERMNDQLFVRCKTGMEPTPFALSIADEVAHALRSLETTLTQADFEPGVSEWSFDLAVSDHASVVLLPDLVEHVSNVAPRVSLRVEAKMSAEISDLLDIGAVDLAMGVIPPLPHRFARLALFRDRYICMMRRDHPLAGAPLTLEALAEADHLAIRPGEGTEGRADRILETYGIKRRVTTRIHQFIAAPGIVAKSDMLTLIFERMRPVLNDTDLHFAPIPEIDMSVAIDAVWNRTRGEHDAHRWLRSQISRVTQRLG